MKRLHVHVAVDDLAPATRCYNTLFAAEPTVIKTELKASCVGKGCATRPAVTSARRGRDRR
jgi:hypothetical protein